MVRSKQGERDVHNLTVGEKQKGGKSIDNGRLWFTILINLLQAAAKWPPHVTNRSIVTTMKLNKYVTGNDQQQRQKSIEILETNNIKCMKAIIKAESWYQSGCEKIQIPDTVRKCDKSSKNFRLGFIEE